MTLLQSEISRRREQEVQKLKKDLELVIIQQETSEASLKKRHQEAINDLTDQLEQLNRQRNKWANLAYPSANRTFCKAVRGEWVGFNVPPDILWDI